ncbi:MAG: hypothetical protein O7H39_05410 [Gammaproteobacteria bacterium]|nr:hypothetical protein [Gammaproteobacteria bacterium]
MTKRQAREFTQLSASALDRTLAAGRIRSIKLGEGRSAPVRIVRDQLLVDLGLIENQPRRRRRDRQAERELHAAAARFGIDIEDETARVASTP